LPTVTTAHPEPWLRRFIAAVCITLSLGLAGCEVLLGLEDEQPAPEAAVPAGIALQPWARAVFEQLGPIPAYVIQAALSDDGSDLDGRLTVTVPNAGPTAWPDLVFRLYPNMPQYAAHISVSDVAAEGRSLAAEYIADATALRIVLPQPLAPGDSATITMQFNVELPRHTETYTLFGWGDDILSLPGFYPTLAVRDQENWMTSTPPVFADVLFNAVADYRLELTAPADLTIVASGVTLSTGESTGSRSTWHIAGAPLRDLTLFASRRWQMVTDSAAGAVVSSYFPAGATASGEAALYHAAAALRLFSDLYGPYPYREFKVVAAPLGRRGMEYSGVVAIGEALYDQRRDELAFLVAHETAHQWWYAQVGNDPLTDPWLDEGLAEYAAFDYYRGIYGPAAAEDLLTRRWQAPVRFGDGGGIAGTVAMPADRMDERSYQLLAYAKAALFFNALREQVGDEAYRQTLQAYVRAYRWQIATPQQLLGLVQSATGADVRTLVSRWLE
jgi:aminopeptidase N